MSDRRMLVIGLDALDPDSVMKWADEGSMPNFARLIERSAWNRVQNPRGMEAGSAWPTFYYGMMPGQHPQHDSTRRYDPKTYQIRTFRPDELREDYIWDHLSKKGKRVCVIDAAYTFCSEKLNGIMVHDWGVHAPAEPGSKLQFMTYPAELAAEIKDRFGLDPLGGRMCDDIVPRTKAELRDFSDKLIDRAKKRGKMAEMLWAREPWDFFFVGFSEAHCIGHHTWHLNDPEHPEYAPDLAEALGNPMKRVYQVLDEQVGALLELAGEDVVAFVYCSHGMGPSVSATRLLDKILTKLEGRRLKDKTKGVEGKMRGAWRSVSPELQKKLRPLKRLVWRSVVKSDFQDDRESRKCFEIIVNDSTGGVRVNLAGREAHGVVQPGIEYEEVLDQVTRDLKEVVNSDTGEALVSEVVRTDEHFQGSYRDLLPDLLISWNKQHKHAPIRRVYSDKIGTVEHDSPPPRTGDHKPEGLFLCAGPGVRPGRLNETHSVADLAPNLAAVLDAPMANAKSTTIAALMDGVVENSPAAKAS